jgi:succinyl-CoA synthetase beta subunit
LKLYEYEAKTLLANYGIPIPRGETAETTQQTHATATKIGQPVAVKAQVLVAGRGKAGGILFAETPKEAETAAQQLLNNQIKGFPVTKILVEQKIPIKKELYFGITVDRLNRCYVAVASALGGMGIEEIAEQSPEQIQKTPINPQLGISPFHARQIAQQLGYNGNQMLELARILEALYRAGMECDAELIELNPLAETTDGNFIAADARIIIDDNALFRHAEFKNKQLTERRDLSLEESEALRSDLNYVKLDGNVGVVGNGAGLVMATMDMINLYGGKPANFLDMGGGAPPERIEAALRIVLSDAHGKVLFVNILGGITLCDKVARGIIQAKAQLKASKPLVIRLVGTNEAEGKRILAEAGIPVFDSMEEAAEKAVAFAEKEAEAKREQ